MPTLSYETSGAVARVTLTRPEVHNAFDDALIAELTRAFDRAAMDGQVETVILAAEGRSFSAGADLNWMRRMAGYGEAENLADARALGRLLQTIDSCPKTTIARVQGAAFGGGVGLVAACDIAVASPRASFCLSEVKLGIVPAVISPFVVRAIGARAARRFFQTAERFDAATALRLGLLSEVAEDETELDAEIDRLLAALGEGGPVAKRAAKDLAFLAETGTPDTVLDETCHRIAAIRVSAEGQEGLGAFLDKRSPAWRAGKERG